MGESTRVGRDFAREEVVGPAGPVEAADLKFVDDGVDSRDTSGGDEGVVGLRVAEDR